jgi:putative hydrolase of the HAD superfamily
MGLDAIFFDIDDTLFSTTVFADKARRAAVDAMIKAGLRADREACMRELEEVLAEFSSNYPNHFDKMISRLPASAAEGRNTAILVAAGVCAYHETKASELKVYDDVYEVLRWLAEKPVVRGIVSSGLTIKQAEKVIRLRINEFLTPNAIFFTEQIGINKPNPKLYRRVLDTLGLAPQRTMYVGDNTTHDIDPCKQLGIVAVHNRRSGRHATVKGLHAPDHVVSNFYELRQILVQHYGF